MTAVISLILLRYCKVQVFIHVSESTCCYCVYQYYTNVVSKQMKTINFSLSSPKYSTQGWVVRVSSGKHHQVTQQVNHRRRKRRDRASVQTTDSFLLPTITFRNDISNTKVKHTTLATALDDGVESRLGYPRCKHPLSVFTP